MQMLQRPLRPLGLDSSGLLVVFDKSIHTVLKDVYISSNSLTEKRYTLSNMEKNGNFESEKPQQ